MRAVLPFRNGAGSPAAPGGRVLPRVAASGAELDILVLAADTRGCVGVDLASGAFVRATHPESADPPLEVFAVATGRIAPGQWPDASRPETVALEEVPVPSGYVTPRRAERFLAPLQHPERGPLLGFAGRAVPYWTLSGDRPSVTLVAPVTGTQIRRVPTGYDCRFTWHGARHQFPLGDRQLAADLDDAGWPRYSARDLHGHLGYRVGRLLVVLTPPHHGYCYKVVAALLPGP